MNISDLWEVIVSDYIVFKDNMTKESKKWELPMVCFFIMSALFPLVLVWNDISTIEFIVQEMLFVFLSCYFLYGYMCALKYSVVVTKEKIILGTLREHTEIELKDIQSYSSRKYRKSELYLFSICYNDEKIFIYTRFKDRLEKILEDCKSMAK